MRVLSVFGTRPEAIKMAPVVNALKNDSMFESKVCVTAQHREMLDQVLDIFAIHPEYDLDIMKPGQSLTDITNAVLAGMEKVYKSWEPDLVLVHGDTATTFAASLSAYYSKIQVGHIEAGLRTANKYSPWPEEMFRQMTGRLADIHFAPTRLAQENLLREGVPAANIHITGNTIVDALKHVLHLLHNDHSLQKRMKDRFQFLDESKKILLVTSHRRENFESGIENICLAVSEIANRENIQIVFPVHLNPKIQEIAHRVLGKKQNVWIIEPQAYLDFIYLMEKSSIILTDSGGIQEEGCFLGKPMLITRDTTERVEALSCDNIKLIGTERETIVRNVLDMIHGVMAVSNSATSSLCYGNGTAAQQVVEILKVHGV